MRHEQKIQGERMPGFIRSKLRDAVFGMQDGSVSTLGALTGIAAGTQSSAIVILSGLVIVTVESLSMAAGSYLSATSQRQYLERLLREEEEAIEQDPEGEQREIQAMYRARLHRRRDRDRRKTPLQRQKMAPRGRGTQGARHLPAIVG